jgi:hypothetical protein
MQPPVRRQREWIWLVALVLLASLHFDWLPGLNRGPRHDTYSTYAEGKKAFYLVSRDRGYDISRSQKRLPVLIDSLGTSQYAAGTLCLLGPARYPTEGEWGRIMEWVDGGGSLLIAARSGSGGRKLEFEIPGLDVSVESNTGAFETTNIKTPTMTEGKFIWQSGGEIETPDASEMETLVETNGTLQAVGMPYGGGYVVVVASDFIFSNQSLAWSDYSNAELAIRLLDSADTGGGIAIDESLNASGTPKVVGLMLEPFLWPVTVQLLIALLLFAWWRSRQFGAVLPRSVKARHNIVDHTDTLGMLYFQSGSGAAPLKSYLKQLESELRLSSIQGVEERALAPIAARMGKSVASIRKVFSRARQYAESGHLDRKTAGRIIHRLSLIRYAMKQPPKDSAKSQAADDD